MAESSTRTWNCKTAPRRAPDLRLPPVATLSRALRLLRIALAVAGLGWATLVMPAERTLYKSVLPNGRVVYGDAPDPKARRNEKITVENHPADPVQSEAGLRALAMTRLQLLRDAEARALRLRQLDRQIVAEYAQLQAVEADRERGSAVQEGDRQGRRLVANYWQRRRGIEAAALQARRRLDALLRERSALL
ncbi:DUF4124 domain-containing protein [Piscinibacter koreensis]|uniref:DUF4124 domain-containing protein n=1 Tax=Piscinibacter koreensis TaxID=2742824 RepID=A0A7Y6NTM4_9BURK|nr:DUF4124 domain-containing protein [Schlegelella koreensis]NUZ09074.1 DUF4124 domain-containing protein [Schlegelella koreensis]